MSKRQRFFVELIPDEVTVISWKKLLADHAAKRLPTAAAPKSNIALPAKTTVATAGSSQLAIGLNHHATTLKNSTELKPLTKGRGIQLKLPIVSYYRKRKRDDDMMKKREEDESLDVVVMAKGKVHRSMPAITGKTSCRTKKKTKACFCCPQKDPET